MNAALQESFATIEEIRPLTDSIMELQLRPDIYIDYQAGQYLQILLENNALCYSIANAPLGSKKYELHIRHDRNNVLNQALFAEIRKQGRVKIRLPLGKTHVQGLEKEAPIIFIAGGTGFAPIKAMIEQLLAEGDARFFELYWGARSQSDLYMDEMVKKWVGHVAHFSYFSLLSTEGQKDTLATRVLTQHQVGIEDYQMVVAGPLDMTQALRAALLKAGALPTRLHSDAY